MDSEKEIGWYATGRNFPYLTCHAKRLGTWTQGSRLALREVGLGSLLQHLGHAFGSDELMRGALRVAAYVRALTRGHGLAGWVVLG